MYHGPDDPLSRQSCRPVSKAEGRINEDFPPPPDSEEDGGDRVENKPAVPSGKIQLENKDSLPRVPLSGPLNSRDDVLGVW